MGSDSSKLLDDKHRYYYVDNNISQAESLPSSAFNSTVFLELELKRLFPVCWQLVPLSNKSSILHNESEDSIFHKKNGMQIPFSLNGNNFFLQRDEKGRSHCFPNVCTHAWYPLVEQLGVKRSIICPQHGRQFNLQGKFLSQAGFNQLDNFPRETDHLQSIPVREWNNLYFVCIGQPVASFDHIIKEVDASMPGLRNQKLRMVTTGDEIREVAGNWKQHAWNYMDNYHIRFIHKGPGGLADAVDLSSYQTEVYDYSALQWVYAKDPMNGLDSDLIADRFRDVKNTNRRVFALWWFIFPNLTFNLYPWGISINIYTPHPTDPNKTIFHWYHYVLDETKFENRNKIWLDEQVDAEDIGAIKEVSENAKSKFAVRGRFAPKEEVGPHWFHRRVYETMFER